MDQTTPTPAGDTLPIIPPQPIQGNQSQSRNASSRSIDRTSIEDIDDNMGENIGMDDSAEASDSSTFSPNHSPDSNELSSDQWKTRLSSAKLQWSKLEQEELVACGGNPEQLSTLIQKRYSMNKSEADKQVQEFFSKS